MKLDLRATTPTLCALLGIGTPAANSAHPHDKVLEAARKEGIETVERCLVYSPDAVGRFLVKRFPAAFHTVAKVAPVQVLLRSVVPPKTPVCFASMWTGAQPEAHGIKRYERPLLSIETIFDALSRAGRRTAIVAVHNSSMDIIFRNRAIDYYSEPHDQEVSSRAIELLARGEHEVIFVYHCEYDDTLHRTTPLSEGAVCAMHQHVESFRVLAEAWNKYWVRYKRMIMFAPDHGAHVDPATGRGDHGLEIAEDMELVHFYGFAVPSRQ